MLNLATALKAEGFQVDILLMSKEGEFLAGAELEFNVVDLQCDRTYKLPGKLLSYLTKQRPSFLLSSFWKLNLCACIAKMFYPRFRLLLWEHSPPSISKNSPTWLYAISASIFYQLASRVIAVSSGVHQDIAGCTLGLKRKLVVIFNPINPPDTRLLVGRSTVNSESKLVISVGRLDEPKNPQLLLEAFALLPEHCNAKLVMVGDGPLRGALEELQTRLGLQDRLTLTGFHPNPYELMAEADLLVVPSDREGLPTVIVEALYCGLRVVSTDCGAGIRDILLDNKYGTIVPVRDKVSLAQAIEAELSTQYPKQVQQDGAKRFLPNIVVNQFLALMK